MATPTRVLYGRSSELEGLTGLVDEASAGAFRAAVIEGPPGIGKTRLLDEALAFSEGRGLRVVRGGADELERDRPFRAFANALGLDPRSGDARRAEIGRWLVGETRARTPSDSRSEKSDLGYRIVEAVADLLEDWCIDGPVIVGLEDLHWADPSTLRGVRFIGRRLSRMPFALLLTLRSSPSIAELDLAVEELLGRGARHILLNPLDEGASKDLSRDLLAAEPGPNLSAQIAGAGGTPLFVIEMLSALREEGVIEIAQGRAEVRQMMVPPSLRLTMLRRLSFLPTDTIELLKAASILGKRFSPRDLATLTGRTTIDLLSSLTEALRAGVLDEVGERLAYRHDLIREAIYEEVPASVRKDLHRDAGRALAQAGAPAAQIAEQMSLGASSGDNEAIQWLRKAAREAGPHSAEIAVRLLERAVGLSDPVDSGRRLLLRELLLPLISVGRMNDAERVVKELHASEEDPAEQIALNRILAIIVFFRGDRPRARELFESNSRVQDTSDAERATDIALTSLAAMYSADFASAKTLAEKGWSLAEASKNDFASAMSLMTLSGVNRLQGSARDAVALASQAVDFSRRAKGEWADFFITPLLFLGTACLEGDALDEAERALRAGLDEGAVLWDTPWKQMYLAAKAFFAGNWDDAIAEAQAGLSFLDDLEFTPFAAVLFPLGLIAAIAAYRAEWETARDALDRAEDELAKSGPQLGVDTVMWARAMVLEADGDRDAARAVLDDAWNLYNMLGYQLTHRCVVPDLVRLAIETGDVERAASVTAELDDLAARAKVATARGVALRCRGLLENDAELLVSSVEAYREGPRPFERALACEDAAVALARDGRVGEARTFLDEAMEVYEIVGANRLVDRAQAAVRPFGVRLGRRGPRRRPSFGWDSLTPTELRVVELVAQRLTNREIGQRLFISPRTVETHVAHLFAKLDVSSRRELGDVAARHLGQELQEGRQSTK